MTPAPVDVDISGLRLRFEGLTPALAAELRGHWGGFLAAEGPPPALVIRVEDDDRTMKPGRFMEGALEIDASDEAVTFRIDEGDVRHAPATAHALVRLARGDDGRRFWGLVNLVCAAVGWRLLSQGGGALHAAAALIDERAYLLIGPSGSGKTTWARTASEAGLPVISDDCVLVAAEGSGLVALGSPFRSKDLRAPGRGRWQVAALLLPQWGPEPKGTPVARLALEARIAANLLFSSHTPATQSVAAAAVAAIAGGAPAHTLSFRPDGSWIAIAKDLSRGR